MFIMMKKIDLCKKNIQFYLQNYEQTRKFLESFLSGQNIQKTL